MDGKVDRCTLLIPNCKTTFSKFCPCALKFRAVKNSHMESSVSGERRLTLWPSGTWPLMTDRMSCRWIPVLWLSPKPMTSHRSNPSGSSSVRDWILKDCNWHGRGTQSRRQVNGLCGPPTLFRCILAPLLYLLGAASGGAAHHGAVGDSPTERWLDWTDETGLPRSHRAQEEDPGLRDIRTLWREGGDDFHQAFLSSETRWKKYVRVFLFFFFFFFLKGMVQHLGKWI